MTEQKTNENEHAVVAGTSSDPAPAGTQKEEKAPSRWRSVLTGVGAGLGIALSVYGWIEARADIRIDVNSIKLVRNNPSLASLKGLPEYEILKYDFLRETVAAKRDLIELSFSGMMPNQEDEGSFLGPVGKRNVLEGMFSTETSEAITLLDDGAQQRWLDETDALAKDSVDNLEARKKLYDKIEKDIRALDRYAVQDVGGAPDSSSIFWQYAQSLKDGIGTVENGKDALQLAEQAKKAAKEAVEKAMEGAGGRGKDENVKIAESAVQEAVENAVGDVIAMRSACNDAATQVAYQFCDAMSEGGLGQCDGRELLLGDEWWRVERTTDGCLSVVDKMDTYLKERQPEQGTTIDVAKTRAKIEESKENAAPRYIEVNISARNESRGFANISTSALLIVHVNDAANGFPVKMALVEPDAGVDAEAYRNLTYRSAPWDKLSPEEQKRILAWWKQPVTATLELEDNDGDLLVSPPMLFAEAPDDERVRGPGPLTTFWAEWQAWLRPLIVLAGVALATAFGLFVARVYRRRHRLIDVLFNDK